MSQRDSGYARLDLDTYETPSWVTEALVPHIPERIRKICEPAAGSGKMVRALQNAGYEVESSDISQGDDFLLFVGFKPAIVTNPPYILACEFIARALATTSPDGFVAMLLRTDFDHAKSRAYLFDEQTFAKKLVLRERIRWIENSRGSPSFNHAWFMWDYLHQGPPILAYH
jgi:hypothetical protein